MNLAAAISIMAGGMGSGCKGPNCGRPYLPGSAAATWKESVEKAGKKFPKKVLEGLRVDWTDMPLAGGFAYSPMGNRLLIGFGEALVKDGIAHELSHAAYEKLAQPLKDEAQKLFGKKWVVQTEITSYYQNATWEREGFSDDYSKRLAARKQIQEQTAEAIRAYIRKEPLSAKVKDWAGRALESLK